jgi:hypothetical protein
MARSHADETQVMNSLFSGEDCFLAEPAWQSVTQDYRTSRNNIDDNALGVGTLIHYFQLLSRLPSVFHRAYDLREANRRGAQVDKAKVFLLQEAAEQLHTDFMAWYPTLLPTHPAPKEVPTKDPLSIYPTVLEYTGPWVGSVHMGYWASMLILQECLNQCHYHVDYTISNQLLALNILRSVETTGSGIMGGYRCGYAVRIADEFVDEETRGWLRMWLDRFEKSYAATSAKSYPDYKSQSGQG